MRADSVGPSAPQLRLALSFVAVLVVLTVRLVVLVVIGDEVVQREAVVAGDEVDARVGSPPTGTEDVARAGQSGRQLGHLTEVAAPEAPHAVAKRAIPFRPARRELSETKAVGTRVPGLGDELDVRQDWVLLDDFEEGTRLLSRHAAHEHWREVEAKAVDVHVFDPVAQAVGDESHRARVQRVDAVARARVVEVVALVVGDQAVVDGVIDAPQRQSRSKLIALGRVVVDDVEDDFNAGPVQRAHHGLELAHLLLGALGRVAHVGAKKPMEL